MKSSHSAERSAETDDGTVHGAVDRLLGELSADFERHLGVPCDVRVERQDRSGSTVALQLTVVPSVAELRERVAAERPEHRVGVGVTAEGRACLTCRVDLDERRVGGA